MTGLLTLRADASAAMGTGHVMRMFALGQAWADAGGGVRLLGCVEPILLRERILADHIEFIALAKPHPDKSDLDALLALTRPGEWVGLDGYHFGTKYMRDLRAAGRKILVVDDIRDRGEYTADILLNQNLGAEAFRYQMNPDALTLLGPRYALLRREFRGSRRGAKHCPDRARNILVTFGGSDPHNATGRVLEALAGLAAPDLCVKVVVGAANAHLDSLRPLAAALPCPCGLLQAVRDMPGLMAWADLAISAAGSTCWELCSFGVPMLLMPIADNQAGIGPALAQAGAARVTQPETLVQDLRTLVDDAQTRRAMAAAGQRLVDGQGAERVVAALQQWQAPRNTSGH